MKNWMLELDKYMEAEDARLVVQLVAGTVMVAAIVAGNWHFINF